MYRDEWRCCCAASPYNGKRRGILVPGLMVCPGLAAFEAMALQDAAPKKKPSV
jgi:hypothetical protein